MGRTRKDAQQRAAENALRGLAGKIAFRLYSPILLKWRLHILHFISGSYSCMCIVIYVNLSIFMTDGQNSVNVSIIWNILPKCKLDLIDFTSLNFLHIECEPVLFCWFQLQYPYIFSKNFGQNLFLGHVSLHICTSSLYIDACLFLSNILDFFIISNFTSSNLQDIYWRWWSYS